jgi:uncharacterized protein YhaN
MLAHMKKLAWVFVVLCACGGGNKAAEPAAPVANETKAPDPAPDPTTDPGAAKAQVDADRAAANADEARKKVEALQGEMTALDATVNVAIDGVTNAQNDADRQAAKAKLDKLRKQKAELENRLAEAKAQSAKAEREKGTKISPACLDNPLAKGCN